jgi:hypothetical protein
VVVTTLGGPSWTGTVTRSTIHAPERQEMVERMNGAHLVPGETVSSLAWCGPC